MTSDGYRLGASPSYCLASALDTLARLEPSQQKYLLLDRHRVDSCVVVTGRPHKDDVPLIASRMGTSTPLTLVTVRESRVPVPLTVAGSMVVVVPVTSQRPFPISWNETMIRCLPHNPHIQNFSRLQS